MSTLRTFNLQNPDSGTVNIEMDQGGNTLMTGIATVRGAAHFTSTSGSDAVGIGTDITAYKLDVRVTGAEAGLRVYNPDTSSNASGILRLGNDDNQNAAFLRLNSSNNTSAVGGAGSLVLGHGLSKDLHLSTAGVSRLRITSAGDMGLGTVSPRSITNFGSFAINGTAGSFTDYFLNGTRTGTTAVDSNGFTSEAVGSSTPFRVITNGAERLRITSSGIINSNNYSFNGQGTNTASDVYLGTFAPGSSAYAIATNGAERFRITSAGKIGLDGMTNPVAKLHIGTEDDAALTAQTLFVEGAKTGYANYTGLPQNQLCVYDNTASTAGSGGAIGFGANCGGSQQTWIAAIESQRDSGTNDASNYAGSIVFWTRPAQSTPTEKLRIDSAGTIKCGTSATLKAEINSAIGGHQFISQCSDNNNGFEIYQQHGSTTTRNTFAVYANTGGGGAQELQFSIRGDGCITKPKSPAFSAWLSSGNLNAANYNNVIIFNNEQFDNSNSYNTSNGRFTAPVAGKYYFGVQIYAGFDFSGVRVLHSKFVKNGSDYATADMFGGSSNHGGTYYHPTGCGHILIDLAVNDWVAFNSGGFAASGTGNAVIYAQKGTRFFGYLVG